MKLCIFLPPPNLTSAQESYYLGLFGYTQFVQAKMIDTDLLDFNTINFLEAFKRPVLYLGEIDNMPGHCTIVNYNGKIIWGLHTDNFRILTDEEV